MANVQLSVRFSVSITSMYSYLNPDADADVNTKKNRWTTVSVSTLINSRPDMGPNYFSFMVDYTIKEQSPDHTILSKVTDTVFFLPSFATNIVFGNATRQNANLVTSLKGEQHTPMDVTSWPGIANSYFTSLLIKIDDEGDDDDGNATLAGTVEIPISYDVPDMGFKFFQGDRSFDLYSMKPVHHWNGTDFVEHSGRNLEKEMERIRQDAAPAARRPVSASV